MNSTALLYHVTSADGKPWFFKNSGNIPGKGWSAAYLRYFFRLNKVNRMEIADIRCLQIIMNMDSLYYITTLKSGVERSLPISQYM